MFFECTVTGMTMFFECSVTGMTVFFECTVTGMTMFFECTVTDMTMYSLHGSFTIPENQLLVHGKLTVHVS